MCELSCMLSSCTFGRVITDYDSSLLRVLQQVPCLSPGLQATKTTKAKKKQVSHQKPDFEGPLETYATASKPV